MRLYLDDNLADKALVGLLANSGHKVVRLEDDSSKNMKPKQIANAIKKLENSGVAFDSTIVVLNHWR